MEGSWGHGHGVFGPSFWRQPPSPQLGLFILPMSFRMLPSVCPISVLRSSLYPLIFAFYAAPSVPSLIWQAFFIIYIYIQIICGKERRTLIGPWRSAKAAFVRNYLEVYWPCAGGLSAINAIGKKLRDPINSGLAR